MVRVGLVGCGFMGTMHANVYQLLPNADLVGVVDHREEKRNAFAEKFGIPSFGTLEEMVEALEVDAIDICLPTHLHKDATVAAANAGKHVLCEKPMALNLQEADQMIEATQRNGVKLMIGHCIRFWPEYAKLKEYVDSKELGNLVSINLTRVGEFPHWSSENWLANESLSGGGVLDMHIHDSDFVLYLLGEPQSYESWGSIDSRGPGHVFTTLQYPGCVAHLEGGWNMASKAPFKMTFRAIFENGTILFDGGPLTIYRPGQDPFVPEFEKMNAEGGGNISDLGGYYVEIKYFVDTLEADAEFETVTAETSRRSLEFTLDEIRRIKAKV